MSWVLALLLALSGAGHAPHHRPPAKHTTAYCWTAPTGHRYCSERVVHHVTRSHR